MRDHLLTTLAVAAVGVVTVLAAEAPPEAYVKLMKDTNTAAQSLRGHAQAKDYGGIAADAAALRKLFSDTEAFWVARKVEDAIGFARTGAKASSDLETAAKAKNEDGRSEERRVGKGGRGR